MIKSMKWLASAGAMAAAMAATPALAAGGDTNAGTTVTNNVSVTFSVNGTAQTPTTATTDFKVDRKVAFAVTELGTTTTNVTPGQTQQATTFTVTNTTNGTLDVKLAAINSSAKRGTDNYDVTAFAYYLDDGDNVFDSEDTVITGGILQDIPEDGSRLVHVLATIPVTKATNVNLVNGDVAGIRLSGTAWKDDNSGAITTAATNGVNTVDDVLADASANGSIANDGIAYDNDDYTVVSAAIAAAKSSRAVYDPVTGVSANAKMIPGARVEYCIAVTNTGTVSASNIVISDKIPTNTTFVPGSIRKDSTVASGVCSGGTTVTDATGYDTSVTAEPKVLVTLGETVDAGETWGLRFEVTVN